MSQQLESRENLRRLAEGQIKEMTVDGTSTANGTARTKHITITYADGDRLVLTKVQRDANVNLPRPCQP